MVNGRDFNESLIRAGIGNAIGHGVFRPGMKYAGLRLGAGARWLKDNYEIRFDPAALSTNGLGGVKITRRARTRGGRYGDVRAANSGGQVHHMPASDVSPYTHHTGPAIWMTIAHHKRTASWGSSKEAIAYRQRQADLIAKGRLKDAVQMDIDDIRSKFGSKYDTSIQQMLDEFSGEF